MIPLVEGIDVHGSKGWVDWTKVRASGVDFAFVKASEGLTFKDARIAQNLRGARDAGILVGPYHYARPDIRPNPRGAEDEAWEFCTTIMSSGWDKTRDLRPVLDIEVGFGDLSEWALAFCKHVEQLLGVAPIVYTYQYFALARFRGGKSAAALAGYQLWLADYRSNDPGKVPCPEPWSFYVCHQYTSRGSTPGVGGYCDLNYARLLEPLKAFSEPPDTSVQGMWKWIRWYRGHGEYKPYGRKNPVVRPNVPKRIPARWWARLVLNVVGRQPA